MIELIVALIVSSILIFFALNFFSTITNFFNNALKKNNEYSQALWLNTRLINDFYSADSIKYINNTLCLYSFSNKIQYEISKNAVTLRDDGNLNEVINLDIKNVQLTYLNNSLVNSLYFEIALGKNDYEILIVKDYSKTDIYNQASSN